MDSKKTRAELVARLEEAREERARNPKSVDALAQEVIYELVLEEYDKEDATTKATIDSVPEDLKRIKAISELRVETPQCAVSVREIPIYDRSSDWDSDYIILSDELTAALKADPQMVEYERLDKEDFKARCNYVHLNPELRAKYDAQGGRETLEKRTNALGKLLARIYRRFAENVVIEIPDKRNFLRAVGRFLSDTTCVQSFTFKEVLNYAYLDWLDAREASKK